MENFALLFQGFGTVFTVNNIAAVLLGAVLGLIVGAMPGIGSLAGVALLLPLTFNFNPTTAMIMLGALYYSNMYGGSFSAILINVPGDNPAVMTAIDGYPLATQRNRPGAALFTANTASFIGGTIGILILTFLGPWLANVGLKFGPAEMTAVLLIAMTSISWLVGENPIKGILITMLGIFIAIIGMDTLTGTARYDFGSIYLLGGIKFTPFVIGAVGFSQVMKLMKDRNVVIENELTKSKKKIRLKDSLITAHDFRRILPPALRSGILGTFVGVLPGAGATTGAFMGYGVQKMFKNEDPLGSGAVEGVAACEAANNAAAAGAFAPLLALGIPGSGTGAVLLGGLLMWGLNPGPLLFSTNPDFAWGLISSLYIANIFTLIVAMLIIPYLTKILLVPVKFMIPCIAVICVVGSYATTNSMYGVVIMFISGLVGYVLSKHRYPTAPMLLAFVLSPLLESNLRKAFIISNGSMSIFFEKPIARVFMIIFFAIIAVPVVWGIIKGIRSKTVSQDR
ncbi:MAG: tripartite tricarboxylate transporter permease [Treponema sp.]|nr:tripartite tricarboxylate transporter permease [Treponema sp.]